MIDQLDVVLPGDFPVDESTLGALWRLLKEKAQKTQKPTQEMTRMRLSYRLLGGGHCVSRQGQLPNQLDMQTREADETARPLESSISPMLSSRPSRAQSSHTSLALRSLLRDQLQSSSAFNLSHASSNSSIQSTDLNKHIFTDNPDSTQIVKVWLEKREAKWPYTSPQEWAFWLDTLVISNMDDEEGENMDGIAQVRHDHALIDAMKWVKSLTMNDSISMEDAEKMSVLSTARCETLLIAFMNCVLDKLEHAMNTKPHLRKVANMDSFYQQYTPILFALCGVFKWLTSSIFISFGRDRIHILVKWVQLCLKTIHEVHDEHLASEKTSIFLIELSNVISLFATCFGSHIDRKARKIWIDNLESLSEIIENVQVLSSILIASQSLCLRESVGQGLVSYLKHTSNMSCGLVSLVFIDLYPDAVDIRSFLLDISVYMNQTEEVQTWFSQLREAQFYLITFQLIRFDQYINNECDQRSHIAFATTLAYTLFSLILAFPEKMLVEPAIKTLTRMVYKRYLWANDVRLRKLASSMLFYLQQHPNPIISHQCSVCLKKLTILWDQEPKIKIIMDIQSGRHESIRAQPFHISIFEKTQFSLPPIVDDLPLQMVNTESCMLSVDNTPNISSVEGDALLQHCIDQFRVSLLQHPYFIKYDKVKSSRFFMNSLTMGIHRAMDLVSNCHENLPHLLFYGESSQENNYESLLLFYNLWEEWVPGKKYPMYIDVSLIDGWKPISTDALFSMVIRFALSFLNIPTLDLPYHVLVQTGAILFLDQVSDAPQLDICHQIIESCKAYPIKVCIFYSPYTVAHSHSPTPFFQSHRNVLEKIPRGLITENIFLPNSRINSMAHGYTKKAINSHVTQRAQKTSDENIIPELMSPEQLTDAEKLPPNTFPGHKAADIDNSLCREAQYNYHLQANPDLDFTMIAVSNGLSLGSSNTGRRKHPVRFDILQRFSNVKIQDSIQETNEKTHAQHQPGSATTDSVVRNSRDSSESSALVWNMILAYLVHTTGISHIYLTNEIEVNDVVEVCSFESIEKSSSDESVENIPCSTIKIALNLNESIMTKLALHESLFKTKVFTDRSTAKKYYYLFLLKIIEDRTYPTDMLAQQFCNRYKPLATMIHMQSHDVLAKVYNKQVSRGDLYGMAEFVKGNHHMQEIMMDFVLKNRHTENMHMAAANVITVLNYSGFSFQGLDLSGVCIPNADLSGANLHKTKMASGSFQGVNFTNCFMQNANLCNSVLERARFGPVDFFRVHHTKINDVCHFVNTFGVGCVATASQDRDIKIWDVESGEFIGKLTGHAGEITRLIYLLGPSNESWLLSGSKDFTIRLWDISSGMFILSLLGHDAEVSSLVLEPQSSNFPRLCSGGANGKIYVWDLQDGSNIFTIDTFSNSRISGVFWFESQVGFYDGSKQTISFWNAENGERSIDKKLPLHILKEYPNNAQTNDSPIQNNVNIIEGINYGHDTCSYRSHYFYHSNCHFLVLIDLVYNTIKVIELRTTIILDQMNLQKQVLTSEISCLSDDKWFLLLYLEDGHITIWNLPSLFKIGSYAHPNASLSCLKWSKGKQHNGILVTGNSNGTVHIIRNLTHICIDSHYQGFSSIKTSTLFRKSVECNWMITGHSDGMISVWNMLDGNRFAEFFCSNYSISSLLAIWNGNIPLLIVGHENGEIVIVNLEESARISVKTQHQSKIIEIGKVVKSDSQLIVAIDAEGTVSQISVSDFSVLKTSIGSLGSVGHISFGSLKSGYQYIVFAANDDSTGLVNIESLEVVMQTKNHGKVATSITHVETNSSQGESITLIIVGTESGTLLIISLADGTILNEVKAHVSCVCSLATYFNKNGHPFVISGGQDGTLNVCSLIEYVSYCAIQVSSFPVVSVSVRMTGDDGTNPVVIVTTSQQIFCISIQELLMEDQIRQLGELDVMRDGDDVAKCILQANMELLVRWRSGTMEFNATDLQLESCQMLNRQSTLRLLHSNASVPGSTMWLYCLRGFHSPRQALSAIIQQYNSNPTVNSDEDTHVKSLEDFFYASLLNGDILSIQCVAERISCKCERTMILLQSFLNSNANAHPSLMVIMSSWFFMNTQSRPDLAKAAEWLLKAAKRKSRKASQLIVYFAQQGLFEFQQVFEKLGDG